MPAVKDIEAFQSAVLVIAYEPTSNELNVPGTHQIPEKGFISGGLGVKDHRVYREYEHMEAEIRGFYLYLRAKYTRRLEIVYQLEDRVCESCGKGFKGSDGQRECYVCRRGE